jgi:hypothetical protein
MGREEVMGFYEQLRETWDADTLEPTGDFGHSADRVVARWIWHAQGHGPESNMEVTAIYAVRNRKVRESSSSGTTAKHSKPPGCRSRRSRGDGPYHWLACLRRA